MAYVQRGAPHNLKVTGHFEKTWFMPTQPPHVSFLYYSHIGSHRVFPDKFIKTLHLRVFVS